MLPCPDRALCQSELHTVICTHTKTFTYTDVCAQRHMHTQDTYTHIYPHRRVHTQATSPQPDPASAPWGNEHVEELTSSKKRKFLGAVAEERCQTLR